MKSMDAGHHVMLSEKGGRQRKQDNGLGNISRHTEFKPAVRTVRSGAEFKAAALKTVNHGYGKQKPVNMYGLVVIVQKQIAGGFLAEISCFMAIPK